MADNNFLSVVGDVAGNIWIDNVLIHAADVPGIRELTLDVVSPSGLHSDCLKFSGVRRLRVTVNVVDGRLCTEDAIDVNHCEDLDIIVGVLHAGRTYCGTIKGGSEFIRLEIKRQIGHGRETDYDYGNFSDQGNDKTTGCTLNVTTADQSPVRVRMLTADKPEIENPSQPYRITGGGIISRLFYPIYNLLKDTLRLVGIKI